MDPNQILQTAKALADQGQYQLALGEYAKLLQLNPADTKVLLRAGDVQARAQDFSGAIRTYDQAAALYAEQGAGLKAIAVYKQVRELIHQHVPNQVDEYSHVVDRLTLLYSELGLVNDALRTLDDEAARLRAVERDEEALELYRRMTDLGPNVPLPHLRLAEGLYRVGQVDEALACFNSATSLLLAAEQEDDALRVLERMLHIKPAPKQAKLAARLYLKRGTEAEGMQALSRLQICFQADPANLETLSMLSQAFELIGHQERSIEVHKEMARLAHEQGNKDVWNAALERLQQMAPDDEQVHALLDMPAPAGKSGRPDQPAPARSIPPPKPARSSSGPPRLELVSSRPPPPSVAPPPVHAPPSAPGPVIPTSSRPSEIAAQVRGVAPPPRRHRPPPPAPSRPPAPPPSSSTSVAPPSKPPSSRAPASAASGSVAPQPNLLHSSPSTAPAPAGSAPPTAPPTTSPPSTGRTLKDYDDVLENSRRVLADARTYRNLSLFDKGIEIVRAALLDDPRSIELREMLRDLCTDVGDRDGAIEQMLEMVDIYVEFERPDHAVVVLLNVLDEEPSCEPAREVLRELVDEHPELREQVNEAYLEPQVAGPGSAQPPASTHPSESVQAPSATPQASVSAGAPAPPPSSAASAPISSASVPSVVPPPPPVTQTASLAPPPPPPPSQSAGAVPPPKLSVEEALEEVEFFGSRGMLGEARRLIEDQLKSHPNHPLLHEALAELEELSTPSQSAADPSAKLNRDPQAKPGDSLDQDLQLSLAELEEAVRASQRPPGPGEKANEVDVDDLFEKFKTSVREQVAENDAATHFDLGLAYKDLGLLDDAIEELEIASREAEFECKSLISMGLIYAEQSMWEKATKIFSRALSAVRKTTEQECTLYYELGHGSEQLKQHDQAIYYFRQVLRRDQDFRDARARVEGLRTTRLQTPSGRPRAPDEEVDRAFEEILGD